jgi:5-methylcytosine-specific restriction endonuclease McrA
MRKLSKQDVLSDIRACFEKYGQVNRTILNDDDEFCSGKTVYNKFGSFSDACRQADVPHDDKPQSKNKINIKCLSCGKTRKVYPYRAENEFPNETSQTCKKCMDKKINTSCSWCGDEITKHRYLVERAENNFCSYDCFGSWRSENIKGENHPRYEGGPILEMGHNWSNIREMVIDRDDDECVSCGMSRDEHIEKFNRDINVHHIMPRKKFIECNEKNIDDANEMDNLKTLCIPCHQKEEAK